MAAVSYRPSGRPRLRGTPAVSFVPADRLVVVSPEVSPMSRILVHVITGPHDPTRAALGLLVARSALAAGHEVDLFFAGDGVANLRSATLAAATGIGTGSMREHVDALAAGGARFYASGLSSKAREVTADGVGAAIVMAPPDTLVELALLADRVLTY
jgi:predicted peroxiredoxin